MAEIGFALVRQAAPAGYIVSAQFRQACEQSRRRSENCLMISGGYAAPAFCAQCESQSQASNLATASDALRTSEMKGLPKMVLRSTLSVWAGIRQPLVRCN